MLNLDENCSIFLLLLLLLLFVIRKCLFLRGSVYLVMSARTDDQITRIAIDANKVRCNGLFPPRIETSELGVYRERIPTPLKKHFGAIAFPLLNHFTQDISDRVFKGSKPSPPRPAKKIP